LDFDDPRIKETFAELTAVYIHADVAKSKCRAQRRAITDTVSLLRENKAAILAMSIPELKAYRGRSFITHLLTHSASTFTLANGSPVTPNVTQQDQIARDQFAREQLAREQSQAKRQRLEEQRAAQHAQQARIAAFNAANPSLGKVNNPALQQGAGKVKYVLKPSCIHLFCSNCYGKGHTAEKCSSAIPPDISKRCFCCQGSGHMSLACPSDKYVKPATA